MKLTTIDDLYDPNNDWKPLLEHVAALQSVFELYKGGTRSKRVVKIHVSGDEDRPPGLHASEMVGCLRCASYSLIGAKKQAKEQNVNMLMRFDMGNAVHGMLQDDFQRMCINTNGRLTFEDEVRINPRTSELAAKYMFASSCDGVFTFYDDNDQPYLRVGLEIKTMSKDEFEKANSPKDAHCLQATFYQKLLDLPLMWYLYYNKSNSNYTPPRTPWLVPFDKNAWNRMESRAQTVHALVGQNSLPEREEGMPCTWCPYSHICEPSYLKMSSGKQQPIKPRKLT